MKRFLLIICIVAIGLCGCTKSHEPTKTDKTVTVTDSLGNTAELKTGARVVSCYGSFAQCWLLSGGTLVGVTQDAIDERHLSLSKETKIVGTVKEINLEKVASLTPDYVILSADLTAHLNLEKSLKQMGIPYGYFRIDTFSDYADVMNQFCRVNDRQDLYEKNVAKVSKRIDEIKAKVPKEGGGSVLLIRAFSTGIKAKRDDNVAGMILKELKTANIADKSPSILEELSVEQIIKDDPDYIFVLTMGDEKNAEEYLKNNIENNPAWSGLSAVKNGRYIMLPKELFHYKPNNRWDESYEYLAKIIYPEIFGA